MPDRKPEGGGNELFYRDENGVKQDAAIWAELLGEDDQNTWEVGVDDPPTYAPPVEKASPVSAFKAGLKALRQSLGLEDA